MNSGSSALPLIIDIVDDQTQNDISPPHNVIYSVNWIPHSLWLGLFASSREEEWKKHAT